MANRYKIKFAKHSERRRRISKRERVEKTESERDSEKRKGERIGVENNKIVRKRIINIHK